jgi:hypothetical protein
VLLSLQIGDGLGADYKLPEQLKLLLDPPMTPTPAYRQTSP